jgi:hypothetical protein
MDDKLVRTPLYCDTPITNKTLTTVVALLTAVVVWTDAAMMVITLAMVTIRVIRACV